jgi:hypothetical protein
VSYSISCVQDDYVDKKGLQLLRVRLIYNRIIVYASTGIKVKSDQNNGHKITDHSKATKMNAVITKQIPEIEDRLHEEMRLVI